ncbi:MAG: hypothetical protein WAU60_06460, partial [Candidatus Competibacter denitrificans]
MSEYRKGSDRQAAGRSDQLIGITQIIGRPWALALMALLSCWWLSVAVGAQAITPDDAGDRFYWGYFVVGGLLLAGLFGIPVVMLAGQRRQLMLERERLSDRLFALTTRQQELEAEIERQRQGAARQRGLEIEIEQLRRAGREFEAEIERLRQRTARQRELEAETQRLRQGTARQRELEIEAEQLR